MRQLSGMYTNATIHTDDIEDEALRQIQALIDHPAFTDTKIAIMPDVHAGKGCVVGYTQKGIDRIAPSIVGVDIGCGVDSFNLGEAPIDFAALDSIIRQHVPSGHCVNGAIDWQMLEATYNRLLVSSFFPWKDFVAEVERIAADVGSDINRTWLAVGSLGGGNHFIAINETLNNGGGWKKPQYWLTIHSGSRNFGLRVAEYWQAQAVSSLAGDLRGDFDAKTEELKKLYTGEELGHKIAEARALFNEMAALQKSKLACLEGPAAKQYVADARIAQIYAELNRATMAVKIMNVLDREAVDHVRSIHNYVSVGDQTIRKGAISAYKNERVVIPLNMKDGVIFGFGKGNEEWNYSAPHGAGRRMSRGQAKRELSVDAFKEQMEGVWSSCVGEAILDEAPDAYKSAAEIVQYVKDTVDIVEVAKEVYNFKATE